MIVKIAIAKSEKIEFFDKKVVTTSGILSKKEKNSVFTSVLSVSVEQSLWGRIFNYGNLSVDVVGKWDVDTKGVKNPKAVKEFLEQYIADGSSLRQIVTD